MKLNVPFLRHAFLATSLLTSACGNIPDIPQMHRSERVENDLFSFGMPASVLEEMADNFIAMDQRDRNLYVLKGMNNSLINETDSGKIQKYFKETLSVPAARKREFTALVKKIEATDDGKALLNKVRKENGHVYVIFEADRISGVFKTKDKNGNSYTVLSLGGKDAMVSYHCNADVNDRIATRINPVRILFHELYHLAHHMNIQNLSSAASDLTMRIENETVRATDKFMAKHFPEENCPRVTSVGAIVPSF